jgi:hypothetical protein
MLHSPNSPLYEKAKDGISSLLRQIFLGFLVFALIIPISGGSPPGWLTAFNFCLVIACVVWDEVHTDEDLSPLFALAITLEVLLLLVVITVKLLVFLWMLLFESTGGTFQEIIRETFRFFLFILIYNAFIQENQLVSRLRKEGINRWNSWRENNQNLKVDLSRANLSGIALKSVNLSGANLKNSDLRNADLSQANLHKADLCEADLRGASVRNADLSQANLHKANLRDADLRGTNLSEANLKRAVVDETKFGDNQGLLEEERSDLKARGAVFQNSSGSQKSPNANDETYDDAKKRELRHEQELRDD